MSPSPTRFLGMDGHNDSIAVASVAQAHGAAGTYLGPIGPRQGAIDQRSRQRPSKATPRIVVSAAGPWGSWLSRALRTKGDACWVVAPALMPQKPGDRVQTDRRDAGPCARLARSGDRTVVDGPPVAEAAMRDLTRARADASSACQDATYRRTACLLRHDLRSVGRAHWGPAHVRWLSEVVWPTPAHPMVVQA